MPCPLWQVDSSVLFKSSTASTDGKPHENGRAYVLDTAPDDVAAPLRAWLCPRNRVLAKLLERHKLAPALGAGSAEGLPWLHAALAECSRKPAGGAAAQQGGSSRAAAAAHARARSQAAEEEEEEAG